MKSFDYDIRNYLKVYNNFLEKDYCESVIKKISNDVDWKEHYYYAPNSDGTGEVIQYENELQISCPQIQERKEIQDKLWSVIHQYITKDFSHFTWFDSWQGYSELRFNKYDVNSTMRTHCDHITSLFEGVRRGIPILSVLGVLNDDYEGGEFIMWDKKIEVSAGSVIVFPSNFMYPHSVNPIKSGTRYSYVSWVW